MTTPTSEAPTGTSPTWAPTGQPHLVDTGSFVFWVCSVAVIYGAVHMFHEVTSGFVIQAFPEVGWAALIVWSIYAAVFAWVLWSHQLFVRRSPLVLLGAFVLGGCVATYFAGQANAALEDILTHVLGPNTNPEWIQAVVAPTNEEILKLLCVAALFLLPRARVHGALDGLFYGAIVGLGFQVVEDYLYTVQQGSKVSDVFGFLIARGFFSGIFAHATYTAITGYGLGYCISRTDRPWGTRLGVGVGSFAAVWTLHMLWDSPLIGVDEDNSLGSFFTSILVKGIPLVVILMIALRAARRVERDRWNGFVAEYADPALLLASDIDDLQTRKSRRAARTRARHEGGRRARKAEELLQSAQLHYVQAIHDEGHDSESARNWAVRIPELRRVAVGPVAAAPLAD